MDVGPALAQRTDHLDAAGADRDVQRSVVVRLPKGETRKGEVCAPAGGFTVSWQSVKRCARLPGDRRPETSAIVWFDMASAAGPL